MPMAPQPSMWLLLSMKSWCRESYKKLRNLFEKLKFIFKDVFRISSTELREDWLNGTLNPKYDMMFHLPKIGKGKGPTR